MFLLHILKDKDGAEFTYGLTRPLQKLKRNWVWLVWFGFMAYKPLWVI